ncbi:MAG: Na+/H+ antiporter subunit C [Gammaproteobacteria bacterium]|nr:Na+/H+ antiporter subunit C [Gammaproteobacteria bacterium]MCH2567484.1 cation:proton antiporter subunit C [Pseudomonadales bacterium]MEE2913225.1 cation:proton antiporter subunit C [Pseudomonadota bacterium]OUU09405.1 MAG: Na+/H+ antiporter subunit C [Gammaproteobacteria bacterium TMED34]
MTDFVLQHFNYWVVIFLMMIGMYTVISRGHLLKKVIGLNIFQTSVFILYISIGYIEGGTVPIVAGQVVGNTGDVVYANPLPHVLILTAIVVGVSTTALALALIIRIRDAYGTLEENDILKLDQDSDG